MTGKRNPGFDAVPYGENAPPPFRGEKNPPSLVEWLHFVDGITSFVAYRQPGLDDETKSDLIAISSRARTWAKQLGEG